MRAKRGQKEFSDFIVNYTPRRRKVQDELVPSPATTTDSKDDADDVESTIPGSDSSQEVVVLVYENLCKFFCSLQVAANIEGPKICAAS